MKTEKTMKKIVHATALIAGILTAGTTLAATDGAVGGISTGDLTITVTVNDEVRISGLSDITDVFDGVNDIVGTSAACVYRNGTGAYAITATGDGGVSSTAFEIDDGTNPGVAYNVEWDDGTGFVPVVSGSQLVGQNTTETGANDCVSAGTTSAGPSTANVRVTVPAAGLLANPAGTLTGVLTLEVAPQ